MLPQVQGSCLSGCHGTPSHCTGAALPPLALPAPGSQPQHPQRASLLVRCQTTPSPLCAGAELHRGFAGMSCLGTARSYSGAGLQAGKGRTFLHGPLLFPRCLP